MSLRREEAELQRALQLSTQQTRALAHLPPYTLSSAPTDDSRDMELRPVQLSTEGTEQSTPLRPRPGRSPYILSPDPEERDHPALPPSRVEVVVPSRSNRDSPDPIDSFHTSEPFSFSNLLHSSPCLPSLPALAEPDSGDGAIYTSSAPSGTSAGPAATNLDPQSHAPSSDTEAPRRSSSRVKENITKKEAQAAEWKRKRAERRAQEEERKAQETTARQELEATTKGTADPARSTTTRRTKKTKVTARNVDSAEPAASHLASLEEPAPAPVVTASSNDAAATAPPASAANSASSQVTTEPIQAPHMPQSPSVGAVSITGAMQTVEPEFRSEHSSPKKTDPGSPIRSPVGNSATKSSSPPVAVTPEAAGRALRPAHATPSSTSTPSGGRWRTPRNDLAGVLAKFPGAKRTGMSRRIKIAPLHASIGEGVKALPPPPPKNKKKVEEDEDEDEEDENGNPKIKVGSREWLMMED